MSVAGEVGQEEQHAKTPLTTEPSCKDEARVGQQRTLTRVWAKRGTRPQAPRDTRYQWACIFGAVCPARGTAAGLVMPFADTPAMNAHLAEIARAVAPGAHAVLVLDGAGWHGGHDLVVPDNISLLLLPPYSPELNPAENVWQYLRANWLAISGFDDYDAIVDACCAAWNRFAQRPDVVTSISARDWATVSRAVGIIGEYLARHIPVDPSGSYRAGVKAPYIFQDHHRHIILRSTETLR